MFQTGDISMDFQTAKLLKKGCPYKVHFFVRQSAKLPKNAVRANNVLIAQSLRKISIAPEISNHL